MLHWTWTLKPGRSIRIKVKGSRDFPTETSLWRWLYPTVVLLKSVYSRVNGNKNSLTNFCKYPKNLWIKLYLKQKSFSISVNSYGIILNWVKTLLKCYILKDLEECNTIYDCTARLPLHVTCYYDVSFNDNPSIRRQKQNTSVDFKWKCMRPRKMLIFSLDLLKNFPRSVIPVPWWQDFCSWEH